MMWVRKATSINLAMAEVNDVLERYKLVMVGDTVAVAGLRPAGLLQLWRLGFAPEKKPW